MMLWLFHLLFPGLHRYSPGHVSMVLPSGLVHPIKQAVCVCGDHQPLGTVTTRE
jgi:hypothetical protein